jgi:hypothetical protein
MDRSRIGLFFTNFHDLFCDHVLALIEQDVGCGVGGPMRAIARHTGARVTGINNNSYQLARLDMHNRNGGLDRQCDGVKVGRLFVCLCFDTCSLQLSPTHQPLKSDLFSGRLYEDALRRWHF